MEELLLGVASSVLFGLGAWGTKKIYKLLKAKYLYVKHLRDNLAELKRKLKALSDIEAEQESTLIRNKKKLQLSPDGETWFKGVKQIKAEVEELKIKCSSRINRKLLPALESEKLGKQIMETTDKVVSLRSQSQEITIIVEKAPTSIPVKILKFFRKWL